MTYKYTPSGVCTMGISFDINDNIITNVSFDGGCPGNHMGISRAVEGKSADEVIAMFEGITCGLKPTSCPDQLAQAIKEAVAEAKETEK